MLEIEYQLEKGAKAPFFSFCNLITAYEIAYSPLLSISTVSSGGAINLIGIWDVPRPMFT